MDNWSVYKLFPLLVLVTVGVDNSGEHVLNNHSLNLGATITKLAVSDKYVYVGGVNFVAQLTKSLDVVLFNLTIGPVLKDEDCRPQTGPCDNQVMVMEIDANLDRLVVCGTAYRGTCTLHSLSDITDWRCLYGDNGADILAGGVTQTTVLHFINNTSGHFATGNHNNKSYPPCRSSEFANTSTHQSSYRPQQSTIMIAGYVYRNSLDSEPMLMSLRQINYIDDKFIISYVLDGDSKPRGVSIKPGERDRFFTDFKLSFYWQGFSYLLSTQNYSGTSRTVVTRVDHNTNVFSFVETELVCGENNASVTSFTVGKFFIDKGSTTLVEPVLLVAVSTRSGAGMCVYMLQDINTTSEFSQTECDKGTDTMASPVTWVNGSIGKCEQNKKNLYVKNSDILRQDSIENSSQPIQQIYAYTIPSVSEQMDIFLDTNSSSLSNIKLHLIKNRTNKTNMKSLALPDIRGRNIGVLDETNAEIFLVSGKQIYHVDIDNCSIFSNCSVCQRQTHNCRWCPKLNKCKVKVTDNSKCGSDQERRTCPPKLLKFTPTTAPTNGGTVLTLYGELLGDQDLNTAGNVTVCGQPCDNTTIVSDRVLTCRTRPQSGPTLCNITVETVLLKHSHGLTSSAEIKDNGYVQFVKPSASSIIPNYGARSGGTVLTIEGDHLLSGSHRSVLVGNRSCDVITHSINLQCRIANSSSNDNNVMVTLTIDNFTQTLKQTFNFRPDPQIYHVTPTKTILSGGIKVNISGRNFDSVYNPRISVAVNLSQIYEVEFCSRNKHEVFTDSHIVCKTPDMKNITEKEILEAQINVKMDGVQYNVTPFEIHRDPKFEVFGVDEVITDTGDITIRGENIPTWLHVEEIKVYIDGARCNVTVVTAAYIKCNVTEFLEKFNNCSSTIGNGIVRQNEIIKTGSVTAEVFSVVSTSTTFNTTPLSAASTTFNTTSLSTSSTTFNTTSLSASSTTLNTTLLSAASTTFNTTLLSASSTTFNTTSSSTTSSGTTSHIPVPIGDSIISPNAGRRKRSLEFSYKICQDLYNNISNTTSIVTYSVSVEIGNFRQPVGKIKFNLHPVKIIHSPSMVIVAAVSGTISSIVVVVLGIVIYLRVRRSRRKARNNGGLFSGDRKTLNEILESVIDKDKKADIDKLIIKLSQLTLGKMLGEGNFGCVYEGLLVTDPESPPVKVAVKTLQDSMSQSIDLKGFVQEAVMMREFQHPNVLGLVGLSEKEPGVPYVVLPFMENGDLLTYVRDPDKSLTLHDVIKFSADIADGMAYLSSLKFVHRDLAARNCMLDSVHRAKVADFGLCRDIYEKGYYTSDNKKKLPIRWMAIESIEHGAYSTKSDVWSLGVVMWEMLTRGVTPYPGVDGWDVINFLRSRRLHFPFFCPDELFSLMLQCWAKDPNMRPTFKALHVELLLLIGRTPPPSPFSTLGRTRSPSKELPEPTNKDSLSPNTEPQNNPESPTKKVKPVPKTRKTKPNPQNQVLNSPEYNAPGDVVQHLEKPKDTPTYSNILSVPKPTVIANVQITIPACYEPREDDLSTAGSYLQLFDNYEPPASTNPLVRLSKKRQLRLSNRNNSKIWNRPSADDAKGLAGKDLTYFELEKMSGSGHFQQDTDSIRSSAGIHGSFGSLMDTGSRDSSRMSSARSSAVVSNLYVSPAHHLKKSPLAET
ncbi:hepatocyte growth factor receptor-like [Physella acuta]|uniref:hepatocyte growth factor receptor-like n=1 Tax=Physella acuta TaxID=109671 RepID=UPI0027DCC13E|nr:hepatocyte growth factor receptor-like [Physella acuta]